MLTVLERKARNLGAKGCNTEEPLPSPLCTSPRDLSDWCIYTIHWVWSQTAVPLEKGKKKGSLLLCRIQSSHASNIIAAAALLRFSHPPALRHALMFYFHWLSLCNNLKLIEYVQNISLMKNLREEEKRRNGRKLIITVSKWNRKSKTGLVAC